MMRRQVAGFTIVEALISLALGLVIVSALLRVYQSNNKMQTYNYALSTIQEDGRYILSVLRRSLITAGHYNEVSSNLNRDIDVVVERDYIKDNPIAVEGDFVGDPTVGSIDRGNTNGDVLTINMMASTACNGSNFDFAANEEFHVVNQYFLDGERLRCRGYDGRGLRGLKAPPADQQAITLLNNVHDFQVLYGVSQPIGGVETGAVTSWVTADRIDLFDRADGSQSVVAIKLAVLIKNDDDFSIDSTRQVKLLGNAAYDTPDDGLYRVFETTILFRNAWYHLTVGG